MERQKHIQHRRGHKLGDQRPYSQAERRADDPHDAGKNGGKQGNLRLGLEIDCNGQLRLVYGDEGIHNQVQRINSDNGLEQRLTVETCYERSRNEQYYVYQYADGNIDMEYSAEIGLGPVLALDERARKTAIYEYLGKGHEDRQHCDQSERLRTQQPGHHDVQKELHRLD